MNVRQYNADGYGGDDGNGREEGKGACIYISEHERDLT